MPRSARGILKVHGTSNSKVVQGSSLHLKFKLLYKYKEVYLKSVKIYKAKTYMAKCWGTKVPQI